MATTMALGAKDASIVDAFLTLMKPLKHDVKALIAERLLTGAAEDDEADGKLSLFNKVKGSWCCDGLTAVAFNLIMVTENVKHLSRIKNIEVENWTDRSK